jgi:hypothetical protein
METAGCGKEESASGVPHVSAFFGIAAPFPVLWMFQPPTRLHRMNSTL